jgi:hypothetical protein
VYCCCSVTHQPSSAGEKALFISVTTTPLPSTSRTMTSNKPRAEVLFFLQTHTSIKQCKANGVEVWAKIMTIR